MRKALTGDMGRVGALFRACEDIAGINRAGVGKSVAFADNAV
jgi:hypothetical protein